MRIVLQLWHWVADRLAVPAPALAPLNAKARRMAVRAAALEQLRESDWPCHPHF